MLIEFEGEVLRHGQGDARREDALDYRIVCRVEQ